LHICLLEYWTPQHPGLLLPDTETAVEAQMGKLPCKLQIHHAAFMEAYA
jgi:hypothetical protein